ncbi:MAG: carbohydrate binding family 9 domain-containing protein [Gemmatimonadetes bacterium]|nr:carbohydrate binding family 9 domain-containing protein [Gemmatimonadota bacterium]
MMVRARRWQGRGVWVAAAVVAVVAPGALGAQSGTDGTADAPGPWPMNVEAAPRPEVHAVPIEASIVVDGRLDEAAWAQAEPITQFVQAQPSTGYPATEQTVVRVLYDRDHLYIGAMCYDSRPDHLIIPSLEQDYETHDSDAFGVTLDTYLDRRNAFMFIVNPGGAVKDGQIFDNSRNYNLAWEGVIKLKTAVQDSGWTVELAIPFTTLRFDPTKEEQTWGVNFSRRIRRNNEDAYWAPLEKRELLHKMSRAGTLYGLKGIRPGRNLTVKPYVAAARTSTTEGAAGGAGSDLDAGLDVKYGITPRLTLDLTYRTDFSQVEVDQEQVNLTRFSLFFPEKRDFFLENGGSFTFGDLTERNYRMGSSLREFTLFHSRGIGLDARGRPIPMRGGGRLTGKLGGFELGLLEMQTEDGGGLASENFAVLRVRRELFGSSDVGAIFIDRRSTGGGEDYNRGYGVDANIRLLRDVIVNSYMAGTDDAAAGQDWAGRLSVAWRDRLWDASAFAKRVGDAFTPGVGFVRRQGVQQGYMTVGVHPRPKIPRVQEVNPYAEVSYITNLESVLETREATLGVGVELLDGGSLNFEYVDQFERLFRAFRISSDATIPVGAYDFWEARASYQSSKGRPFSGRVSVARGDFYSGDRTTLGLGALWRVNYRLSFDLFAERNDVSLPGNAFTADVVGTRIDYAYNTRLLASAFVQYNAAADQVVTNLRFNFIHAPLSDLFLVYTERRDLAEGRVLDRVFSAKLTKLVAF